MTSEVAVNEKLTEAEILERVMIAGDLAQLKPETRMLYYREVCKSLGLNPLTKPFQFIVLNGKLTLYATRTATDQLRSLKGITVDRIEHEQLDDLYVATVYGRDSRGRQDSEVGAVNIANLKGDNRANAIMKAITKAKRRLTLSLAGLGWLDETEVGQAQPVEVDEQTGEVQQPRTLHEQIAARREAVTTQGLPDEPEWQEVEEAPDEPPPPVDHAGVPAAIPTPSTAGSADPDIPMPADPFWSKVDVGEPDDCWLWQGRVDTYGYGWVSLDGNRSYAHRVAYESRIGPIPEGLTIDHLCRTKLCVNPAHMEPVTIRENTLRGDGPTAVNARKDVCDRGHSLTDEKNVLLTTDGRRQCRECRRIRERDQYARERAAASPASPPAPGSGAAPLASEPGAPPANCGAMPPDDDPLGLTAGGPCQLRGTHRVHRNDEGTWPKKGSK